MYSFIYEMETLVVIPILHEETEPQRLSHVPKATQPGNSRGGISPPARAVWLLRPDFQASAFCCLPLATSRPVTHTPFSPSFPSSQQMKGTHQPWGL